MSVRSQLTRIGLALLFYEEVATVSSAGEPYVFNISMIDGEVHADTGTAGPVVHFAEAVSSEPGTADRQLAAGSALKTRTASHFQLLLEV
ncbi:MAG TPA: hypothetical protein PLG17_07845 [Thermodesulfobacteriota bacterium]|mgnify:FL=1|nr:hypothetical protein [Thermodesulfobacteriota bacterium]